MVSANGVLREIADLPRIELPDLVTDTMMYSREREVRYKAAPEAAVMNCRCSRWLPFRSAARNNPPRPRERQVPRLASEVALVAVAVAVATSRRR